MTRKNDRQRAGKKKHNNLLTFCYFEQTAPRDHKWSNRRQGLGLRTNVA